MANKKVANYNVRFINYVRTGGDPIVNITPAELMSNDENLIYILVQTSGDTVYHFYSTSVKTADPTSEEMYPTDFLIQMSDGVTSIKGDDTAGDNWFNEWMRVEVSD